MSTRGYLAGGGKAVWVPEDMYPWVIGQEFAETIQENKGIVDEDLLDGFRIRPGIKVIAEKNMRIKQADAVYKWNNQTKRMTAIVQGKPEFHGTLAGFKRWTEAEMTRNPRTRRNAQRTKSRSRKTEASDILPVAAIGGLIYLVHKASKQE